MFLGTSTVPGVLSQFMVTPGLSRARPHGVSLLLCLTSCHPLLSVPPPAHSSLLLFMMNKCSAFAFTDTSRVSFEAAHRPNFFLHASPSGQLRLAKWEDDEAFWDAATFILRRNTWMPGYDSLESLAKPTFFLHASLARLHLLKYRHTDSFRKATLFRLTGEQHRSDGSQFRSDSTTQFSHKRLGLSSFSV